MDQELSESYFRGDRTARKIADSVRVVADILKQTKPDTTEISITKAQYELLQRWPQASERAGFTFNDSVPYFGKYRLKVAPL